VIFKPLAKAKRQPAESAASHADAEILTLDMRGANFGRNASDGFTRYDYYFGRRISMRRVLAKVYY
jgi:hypothetical protein